MTKGKSLSKRLTTLSLARNLTQRQEHQLVAMADRARKMESEIETLRKRPPTVEQIVDVLCAWDPENGGHEPGAQTHSHDPATGQCYWAYLVGPKIAALGEDPS